MRYIAMKCGQCGAALPPRSRWSVIDCSYCGARTVLDGSSIVLRAEYKRALAEVAAERAGRSALRLEGQDYELASGPIRGESCDVYAGWRCAPLPQAVFVKIPRDKAGAARLERESATLEELQASAARGAAYFSQSVPEPVAFGAVSGGAWKGRRALIVRRRSGFVETLADVAAASGRDPRHSVWIWKRLLEVLDWTHRAGRAHAALVPRHAVIHARDHGVMLVGWSASVALGERLGEIWSADEPFYAREALDGAPLSARADLVMAARCVAFSLTGRPDDPGRALPAPLQELLTPWIDGTSPGPNDAWTLREAVSAAASAAFGPPKYAPLKSPAWAGSR
jgi:hypothetical protein